MSYRNQFDLQNKSVDWFLYDKDLPIMKELTPSTSATIASFKQASAGWEGLYFRKHSDNQNIHSFHYSSISLLFWSFAKNFDNLDGVVKCSKLYGLSIWNL